MPTTSINKIGHYYISVHGKVASRTKRVKCCATHHQWSFVLFEFTGNRKIAKKLLEHGANVNVNLPDDKGRTPLHLVAATSGNLNWESELEKWENVSRKENAQTKIFSRVLRQEEVCRTINWKRSRCSFGRWFRWGKVFLRWQLHCYENVCDCGGISNKSRS